VSAATTSSESSEGALATREGDAGNTPAEVSFGRLLRYFLRLGVLGWGGPIAVVGYMQRDLVAKYGWVSEQDFLDGVALGQIMPGPLAAQVAMWVGYLKRGAFGALAVATAFIAPSFFFVLGVAVIYVHYSGAPLILSLFEGIMPVVMGIMALTAYTLLRFTDGKDKRAWAISAVLFVITAATGNEPVTLVVAAGLLIILVDARPDPGWWRRRPATPMLELPRDGASRLPGLAGPVLGAPALGMGAAVTGGKLMSLALFFLKAGAVTFGFGLAVVPVMKSGVVTQHHWLTSSQFLDGVAIGLATPGPAVISAAFIGYLVAGPIGALVATVAIFTPIYFAVVVPGRWFVRIRDNKQARAFVTGATAAAAGALLGVVVGLVRELNLSGAQQEIGFGVMTLTTLILLVRYKNLNELYLIAAAGGFGLLALH
jgi:chromate transporter